MTSTLDPRTGYFVDQFQKVRDPFRTSHWRLRFNIPLIKAQIGGSLIPDINTDDDISVIIKSATIPKLEVNVAEQWYMGQSEIFTTNSTYDKESTFDIVEPQDARGLRFLGRWQQLAHNTDLYQLGQLGTSVVDPVNDVGINLGSAKYPSTFNGGKSVVRNSGWVFLELYDYTLGTTLLRLDYINIFPKNIGGMQLKYEGSDLAGYTATFGHDRHRITFPSNGTIT